MSKFDKLYEAALNENALNRAFKKLKKGQTRSLKDDELGDLHDHLDEMLPYYYDEGDDENYELHLKMNTDLEKEMEKRDISFFPHDPSDYM